MHARSDYAVARGMPGLVTHAKPDSSYPILRRLGFEEVCNDPPGWKTARPSAIIPDVNLSYNEGSRHYQDRHDTRRLADRIDERLVSDVIDEDDRAFIERRDMLFLATADAQGRPQCSYKGGAPGFVRVLDEHTIAFPNYDGNGMFLSAGNALDNPHVGVLFIDFEERKRLRLNGVAEHLTEHPLLAEWPEAQFLWRIRATEVFPNCPRYIHRYRLDEHSRFVPKAECRTPVPAWKRRAWANDALATDDPAYEKDAEVFER